MLHGTICNDDFQRNTKRYNIVAISFRKAATLGILSKDDDDGSENVGKKMNLRHPQT